MAPTMFPDPPNSIIVKPFRPRFTPISGVILYARPISTPAAPASAEEMPKVHTVIQCTFTPRRRAVVVFSAQARMALPILVFSTKKYSPTISASEAPIMNICTNVSLNTPSWRS